MAMTPPRPDDDTLGVASDLLKEDGFEGVWEYLEALDRERAERERIAEESRRGVAEMWRAARWASPQSITFAFRDVTAAEEFRRQHAEWTARPGAGAMPAPPQVHVAPLVPPGDAMILNHPPARPSEIIMPDGEAPGDDPPPAA